MKLRDAIINIRVPKDFKARIVDTIRGRGDYTITRVLVEGAEYVLGKLESKGKNGCQ